MYNLSNKTTLINAPVSNKIETVKSIEIMLLKTPCFIFSLPRTIYVYFTKKELADFLRNKICVFNLMNVYTRKMYDVFLSHASKDKISYVEELKQTLDILGICFMVHFLL